MPVRLAVTEGTVADCSLALPLIEGIEAEYLLADKAYARIHRRTRMDGVKTVEWG